VLVTIPRRARAVLRAMTVLGAGLLGACSDRIPTRAEGESPEAPVAALRIDCSADVRAGEVRCGEAYAPDGVRALIVGGQGTNVRLVSSGTAYDGDAQILSSNVTVRNLLAQAMGTTDGETVDGVRVFFARLPDVTAGTGSVEVANADGTDVFTAGGQPYFHYEEIVAPQGTSLPKRWEFSLPPTVETFTFSVLVQTPLHDEGAPLRWTRQAAGADYHYLAYAAWSGGGETFVVGDMGLVLRHDGTAWRRMPVPSGQYLRGVWGTSPRSVWAVGNNGAALRFDGNRWTVSEVASRAPLAGVWGASENEAFAVGARGAIVRWNGAEWWTMPSNTRANLGGVWGASATNVFAIGTRVDTIPGGFSAPDTIREHGVMMRYDGSTWTETVVVDSSDAGGMEEYRLTQLVGLGPDELYAAGQWRPTPQDEWAGIVLRWDGGAWSKVGLTSTRVVSLWAGPGGEVLAAGDRGDVLRFQNGVEEEGIPSPGPGFFTASVFRLPSGTLMLGGAWSLYRFQGGQWVAETAPNGLPDFQGVWAADAGNAFAVGDNKVSRWDGAQWTTSALGVEQSLLFHDVWGRSASDVYAVGRVYPHPAVARWNGAAWSTVVVDSVAEGELEELQGVWGTADGSTFAVGGRTTLPSGGATSPLVYDGVVRQLQGGEWPVVATVPTVQLMAVWAASADEVWAVGRQYNPGTNLFTPYAVKIDGPSPTPIPLAQYGQVFDVWGTSTGAVFAVGTSWNPVRQRYVGTVWLYGGSQWDVIYEAGVEQILNEVGGTSEDNVYVVGQGGAVLHLNGTSWTQVDAGTSVILDGVHVFSRGDVLAVGWGGEILRGRR
jgi:hypothetical protein